MKKIGVLFFAFLLVFSLFAFAIAENSTTNSTDNSTTTTTTEDNEEDKDGIEKAFDCLEEKVGSCSGLDIQEIALTILASPDNVVDDCIDELEDKESSNNWGSVKDTALAILALDHVGKDTTRAEQWLLNQNKTPSDLIWYLEQDSTEKTQCKLSYDGDDYTVNIGEDKKIDSSAGPCLTRAQSNFWLQIEQNCLNTLFKISCDKDFIATLLYKQQNSQTIYVLPDTKSEPSFGTIEVQTNAKCFSSSSSCNYEESAWATIALKKTGHDIENFIPYLIASSDANERYLPEAFVYIITGYDDYATTLIQNQELGNYWEADTTPYDKYYDTGLALLAVEGSSEQSEKSREWLLFSQPKGGCWGNSDVEIRDTAMVLWALEGRGGSSSSSGGVTYCSDANYFCIPTADCPSSEQLSNYYCPSLGNTCCLSENLKTCLEYGGDVCASTEFCDGIEKRSSDESNCCLGTCEERVDQNACESVGYICKNECSDSQEEVQYQCDSGVCCRTKTTPIDEGSSLWLWILLILLLILIVIAFIFRERLKVVWFKAKSKFGKDKDKQPKNRPGPPGLPPRPGFPPIRRMFSPVPFKRTTQTRSKPGDDVFKKLKDMSK